MNRDVVREVEHALRAYPSMRGYPAAEARLWRAVIDEVLAEAGAEDMARRRLMELRYFGKFTNERVQQMLPLGRESYFRWKTELVGTVAAKAAWLRLVKP